MNILKTSALAAVLALGSLSANAVYNNSASFTLAINTSDAVSVSFTDSNVLFDDVIPGDTLDGEIGVTITGDTNHTMVCTIDGASLVAGTATSVPVRHDPTPNDLSNSDDYLITNIQVGITACDTSANNILTLDGIISTQALPGTIATKDMVLAVSYGAATTITGFNS